MDEGNPAGPEGLVAAQHRPPDHRGWPARRGLRGVGGGARRQAGRAAPFLIVLAACCVAGGLAQLATAALVPPGADAYPGPLARAGLWGLDWLRRLPWAEGVLLGALVLEALHPARPWHTAMLGVALVAYLLATHLAESGSGPGETAAVLRGQAPVLAAGAGLLVLAAGSAVLPSAGTGMAGGWLRAAASVAAVLAFALCLPV